MTGATKTADGTLLDRFCASWTVREVHAIDIEAPAAVAYRALLDFDFSDARVTRILFRLRGLAIPSYDWVGLEAIGLRRIGADEGRELLVGGVMDTAFRAHSGSWQDQLRVPGKLCTIAWAFLVDGSGERCRVTTETRVRCHKLWVRWLFLPYWFAIRPFSGWIRRDLLRVLKRRAEALPASTESLASDPASQRPCVPHGGP